MIEIPNTAKSEYKEDSVVKSMLVAFRDLGAMLTDSNIVQESETVTESICSAGSFKVGLCEASQGAISVNLAPNVEGDEMTLIQTLGYFEPTVTVDNTKGIILSGDGVTLAAEQEIGELSDEGESFLVEYGGTSETAYWYPDSVDLRATYTDGDLSVIETQHLGSEDDDVTATLDASKHVYPVNVSGTAHFKNGAHIVQQNFSIDNSGQSSFDGNIPNYSGNIYPIKITALVTREYGWHSGFYFDWVSQRQIIGNETIEFLSNNGESQNIICTQQELSFQYIEGYVYWSDGASLYVHEASSVIVANRPSGSTGYYSGYNVKIYFSNSVINAYQSLTKQTETTNP